MLTLTRLEPALRDGWGPDTCDPVDLADWRPDNPARGQCAVTALVVNDLLGGELILGEVFEDGVRRGCHYWNRLPDGSEVDLTRDQFRSGERVTGGAAVVRPSRVPRRCRGQYELLRHRVLAGLDLADPPPAGPPVRIALVLLADPEGRVLLQRRDPDARAEPGQWSLPGGHLEDGEDPEQAARRELAEETGLAVDGDLRLFWQGTRPDLTGGAPAVEVYVYAGRCASPGDAAFLPVADVTTLDLSPTAAAVLAGLVTGGAAGGSQQTHRQATS
jgi:8-oxo-dGTP pyrophosphatase MutT (NUDIX family)